MAATEPVDEDVVLRPARLEEADVVTRVHLASRRAAPIPSSPHPDASAYEHFAARLALDETWVAEAAGEIVGYVRMTDTWVDDLYVLPSHARAGIGSMLLDLAKSRRPAGFSLWVFVVNEPARMFYARHGLVEVERTDGSDNDERAPDIRMAWPGT